jgi:hypothetical protein
MLDNISLGVLGSRPKTTQFLFTLHVSETSTKWMHDNREGTQAPAYPEQATGQAAAMELPGAWTPLSFHGSN